MQKAVLLSPSPFCLPLQVKLEASDRACKHKDLCFKHRPAYSLHWQCQSWRRYWVSSTCAASWADKTASGALRWQDPSGLLCWVFFFFFLVWSPEQTRLIFLLTCTQILSKGLILFPYHFPSLISCECVWTEPWELCWTHCCVSIPMASAWSSGGEAVMALWVPSVCWKVPAVSGLRVSSQLTALSFFFPLCEVEIEADKIMGCDYLHVLCNYMFRLGLDFCHFHLRS